jgi:hypothetical protein
MYHVFSTSVNQNVEQLINIIKFLHEKHVPFMSTPENYRPNKHHVLLPLESKARQANHSIYLIYEGTKYNRHAMEE